MPPLTLSECHVNYRTLSWKINDPTGKSRVEKKPHPTPQPDSGQTDGGKSNLRCAACSRGRRRYKLVLHCCSSSRASSEWSCN